MGSFDIAADPSMLSLNKEKSSARRSTKVQVYHQNDQIKEEQQDKEDDGVYDTDSSQLAIEEDDAEFSAA